jgi:hypothetical protein
MNVDYFFNLLAQVHYSSIHEHYSIKKRFGRVAYNYLVSTGKSMNSADPYVFIDLAALSVITGQEYETKPLLCFAAYLLAREKYKNQFIDSVQRLDEYSESIQNQAGCSILFDDLKKAKQINQYIMRDAYVFHVFIVEALSKLFEEKFNIRLVCDDTCFDDAFAKELHTIQRVSESKAMPKSIAQMKIASIAKELVKSIDDRKQYERFKSNGTMANFQIITMMQQGNHTTVKDAPKISTGRKEGAKIHNETNERLYAYWIKTGCLGSGEFEAKMRRSLPCDGLEIVKDENLAPFDQKSKATHYKAEFGNPQKFSGLATCLTGFKKRYEKTENKLSGN